MRHLLLIIGSELKLNANYLNYIYKRYEDKFGELNECICFEKGSKELPFLLESWINEYDYITIFTSVKLYATTAKIVATLNKDYLVFQNDILVPSKTLNSSENSFLVQLSRCKVNLLKASVDEPLPELLAKPKINFAHFCLCDIDEESALILLDTLAKSYKINILSTSLLANLVLIKATDTKFSQLDNFIQAASNLFKQKLLLGKNPLEFIAKRLIESELKISFAESCTAGLCAAELAKIKGISAIFEGSVVTYSNRLKHEWLGISDLVLQNEYSEKCVYFMLKGAFKTSACDFALAISGVAGEEDDKGVKAGTIFIGAMYRDGSFLQETLRLCGERNFVRQQAVLASFMLMVKLKPEVFF